MLGRNDAHADAGVVVFAFSSEVEGWLGLGRGLYAAEPVFRDAVDACDFVARKASVPVSDCFAQGPAGDTAAPLVLLVGLGVLQVALCDLWASVGVEPDAVLGVGIGEIAAAYCAGALTRDETVRVLCSVSQAMVMHRRAGRILTLTAGLDTARSLCHGAPRPLEMIGTLDRDATMVYTTDEDAAENAVYLECSGRLADSQPTQWAHHTMRAPHDLGVLEAELAGLAPRRPRIPVYSALAGRDVASDGAFDALHWHWMIGHAFYFAEAAAAILRDAPGVVVNIGAASIATPWILATARHLGVDVPVVDSLSLVDEVGGWRDARAGVAPCPRSGPRLSAPRDAPDPLGTAPLDGPMALFLGLLASGPVHQVRHDAWIAVGTDEVRQAFSRPEIFSSRIDRLASLDILGLDPPEHTEWRAALAPGFAAHALADLAVLAAETCHELLAGRAQDAEFDVVGGLVAPLGEQIAARLIGMDDGQLARMRRAAGPPERDGRDVLATSSAALDEVLPIIRRADRLLWLGATLNTKRVITAAVLLLLEDPELRAHVQHRPEEIPKLTDEAARLHPPEMMLPRVTTIDTTLGGVAIPAGSIVMLCVAAANRDPAHFSEPNAVRLDRDEPHLSYGVGVHRCLGARLARIEAEAALRALFDHMPDFRSAQPRCTLRWIQSHSTHGLERLMIAP